MPALTGLGGYLVAGRNDDARDRRTAQREKQARDDARGQLLEQRRHTFYFNVLLELQDAMQAHMVAIGRVESFDRQTLREVGHFTRLPEDINRAEFDTRTDARRLAQRILDDELRTATADFLRKTARAGMHFLMPHGLTAADAETRIDEEMLRLGTEFETLMDQIGANLRGEIARPGANLEVAAN